MINNFHPVRHANLVDAIASSRHAQFTGCCQHVRKTQNPPKARARQPSLYTTTPQRACRVRSSTLEETKETDPFVATQTVDHGETEVPPQMLQRAFLIFNPVAGQEDPASSLGHIANHLADTFELTVLKTKPTVSAADLARHALKEHADLVIASGGDGTVGAVAGVLVDTGVPMGVIPRGTANAFSVALGIPNTMDAGSDYIQSACDVICNGDVHAVDTASVDTSEVTNHTMILLLGVGFEAEVVDRADRGLKNAVGPLAYILAGAQKLVETENFKCEIKADEEHAEGAVAAVTVANAAPPFSILAHGEVGECVYDDGKLEVVGYSSRSSLMHDVADMARMFAASLNGGVMTGDNIVGGRFKNIQLTCDPPQKVVVDGEVMGTTPVSVRVKPSSLRVIRPTAAPEAGGEEAFQGEVTHVDGQVLREHAGDAGEGADVEDD